MINFLSNTHTRQAFAVSGSYHVRLCKDMEEPKDNAPFLIGENGQVASKVTGDRWRLKEERRQSDEH